MHSQNAKQQNAEKSDDEWKKTVKKERMRKRD